MAFKASLWGKCLSEMIISGGIFEDLNFKILWQKQGIN